MIPVTAVMIVYNNEDAALHRLTRDLLPALHSADYDWQLIVIDNSTTRSHQLAAQVAHYDGHYEWLRGHNLLYGPSLNLAVSLARHPSLLYVCSEHGRSHDGTWVYDLLRPMICDSTGLVAMTGCLQDAGPPEDHGFPEDLPHIHIQGGVFAARTDLLRSYPYPTDQHKHWGADIIECFTLLDAGYRLVDVPTIRSVWRVPAGDGDWKYIHDEPVA